MTSQTAGRLIYKKGDESAVLDLLRSVLVAELLKPSSAMWLVSPWISDVPLLDNRQDGFRQLEPTWSRSIVRLGDILASLVNRGTMLVIATRPERGRASEEAGIQTDRFLEDLERRSSGDLRVYRGEDRLHTKGLLGANYLLSGSMNFTYSGVKLNDELVRLTTSEVEVAEARVEFRQLWSDQ